LGSLLRGATLKVGITILPTEVCQRLPLSDVLELERIGFVSQKMFGLADGAGMRIEVPVGVDSESWDGFRSVTIRLKNVGCIGGSHEIDIELLISRPIEFMMFNVEIPKDILANLVSLSSSFGISVGVISDVAREQMP
jgi:hypothetical protein